MALAGSAVESKSIDHSKLAEERKNDLVPPADSPIKSVLLQNHSDDGLCSTVKMGDVKIGEPREIAKADSSEWQSLFPNPGSRIEPVKFGQSAVSNCPKTYSLIDFSPKEIKKMCVAFAFCHVNRESQRIALLRQKDFSLRHGELEVVLPVEESQTGLKSEIANMSMEELTRPVTEEDLTSENVSRISIVATYKKQDSSSEGMLRMDPKLKQTSSAPPLKKRPNAQQNESPSRSKRSRNSHSPIARKYTALEIESIPAPEPELASIHGWTRKQFERRSGATKGSHDKYWYSPICKKKFRSMSEVRRFLLCLEASRGDEEEAYRLFKK